MKKSPNKAIKDKCLDCSGGSLKNVIACALTDCPLYVFRLGTREKGKGLDTKGIRSRGKLQKRRREACRGLRRQIKRSIRGKIK